MELDSPLVAPLCPNVCIVVVRLASGGPLRGPLSLRDFALLELGLPLSDGHVVRAVRLPRLDDDVDGGLDDGRDMLEPRGLVA
eukprot:10486598-Alexandrium_andersonii.AAC.1